MRDSLKPEPHWCLSLGIQTLYIVSFSWYDFDLGSSSSSGQNLATCLFWDLTSKWLISILDLLFLLLSYTFSEKSQVYFPSYLRERYPCVRLTTETKHYTRILSFSLFHWFSLVIFYIQLHHDFCPISTACLDVYWLSPYCSLYVGSWGTCLLFRDFSSLTLMTLALWNLPLLLT